ncbi:MAG: PaaI family thioesterase [Actinomycetota bacterium]
MTREDLGVEGPVLDHLTDAIRNQEVIFRNTFPGMLGVRLTEAKPGYAAGTLEVGPSVLHPGGYAHGGALAGFGDTVAAWATFPALKANETFTTIEFKTNFISGVQGGSLFAEATSIHRGGRTMVLDVRIVTNDQDRRLVAIMVVTQAILRSKDPGREVPPT